jgi:hypothetical protein
VVHLEDTEPTFFAVVSSCGLPCVFATFCAVFDLHEFTLEWCFHSLRHTSRIGGGSSEVRNDSHNTKTVKNKGMDDSTARKRNSLDKLMLQRTGVVPVEYTETVATEPTVAYQQYSHHC